MKILFENKTKYNKQVYNDFLKFHQAKYGTKYKIYTLLIIILLLFCSIINFKYSNYMVGFIYILALIIFFLYRFFNPVKKVSKELKSEKIKKEIEFTFTFYNDYFCVSDGNKFEKNKYWKLYRIFEDSKFFYIYANKEYAFILEKSNFVVGNKKDFITFIKKKLLFKF